MAKTSVENLKARFKRGMYPTEGDFANVFDSYVHKDDGIDINDVTADNGSKTLTTLLQEFKQEILQDAKDQQEQYDDTELKGKGEANEGAISSLEGRVSTNEGDISTLKDDLDTAEDFIAGHETRIQALEERAEVPEGLAEFIAKVNSFLEDADASDATINKWKEIEAFLTGITDTETLTGLLADLKEEILGEIPEQKEYTAGDGIDISEDGVISLKEDENKLDCVKVVADLDNCAAPTGTVAIYTGESNEKYTHGFVYEKKEGEKMAEDTLCFMCHNGTGDIKNPDGSTMNSCMFYNVEGNVYTNYKGVYLRAVGGMYSEPVVTQITDPTDDGAGKPSFRYICSNLLEVKSYVKDGSYLKEIPEISSGWTPLHVMNVIN